MTYEADILALREKGLTYNAIVKELNCSKSTVSYYLSATTKLKKQGRTRDRRNKNRKFLTEYKMQKVCADCGLDYPYWIMEFDHCKGDAKVGTIANMVNDYTLEDIKKEVEKCEVVCANCHRHRTWLRIVKNDNDTYGSTQG